MIVFISFNSNFHSLDSSLRFIIRIDQRGRIVLPVTLRKKLGVKIGEFVCIELANNDIIVRNISKNEISGVRMISRNAGELDGCRNQN